MRFVRWLFRDAFQAEYKRGYTAAVDRILLLPEKVYLNRRGESLRLAAPASVTNCSIIGGNPAIYVEREANPELANVDVVPA